MSSASKPRVRALGSGRPANGAVRLQLLCLTIGLVTGCEPWRQAAECRRVTELSNSTVSSVQELVAGSPEPSADVYEKVAAHYETLHMDLKQLEVKSRALGRPSKRHLALLERLARDARQYAEHLRKLAIAQRDGQQQAALGEQRVLQRLAKRTEKTRASYEAWRDRFEQACSPQR